MRFSPLFFHRLPFLFSLLIVLFLVSVLSASCRTRACRDNFICEGFLCEALLCKTSCATDKDCSTDRGYVCLNAPACILDDGKTPCPSPICRCNPNDLTTNCHKNCFSDADCDKKTDPKTGKQLFAKALGFVCQTDAVAGRPGQCTCPVGVICTPTEATTETAQEAAPSDGSTPEEAASEASSEK